MNNKIDAYNYYKELYPECVIVFHVGDYYIMLSDDAHQAAKILSLKIESEELKLPDDDMLFVSRLGKNGCRVRIVEAIDKNGDYNYPDIEQIRCECAADY